MCYNCYIVMNMYSRGSRYSSYSGATLQFNASLTVMLTNSPVEQVLKRLYSDFSKQNYFTFAYMSTAIGIGIPLNVRMQLLPHQSTEQLQLDLDLFFYLLVVGNSCTEEFNCYPFCCTKATVKDRQTNSKGLSHCNSWPHLVL